MNARRIRRVDGPRFARHPRRSVRAVCRRIACRSADVLCQAIAPLVELADVVPREICVLHGQMTVPLESVKLARSKCSDICSVRPASNMDARVESDMLRRGLGCAGFRCPLPSVGQPQPSKKCAAASCGVAATSDNVIVSLDRVSLVATQQTRICSDTSDVDARHERSICTPCFGRGSGRPCTIDSVRSSCTPGAGSFDKGLRRVEGCIEDAIGACRSEMKYPVDAPCDPLQGVQLLAAECSGICSVSSDVDARVVGRVPGRSLRGTNCLGVSRQAAATEANCVWSRGIDSAQATGGQERMPMASKRIRLVRAQLSRICSVFLKEVL